MADNPRTSTGGVAVGSTNGPGSEPQSVRDAYDARQNGRK